MAEVESPGFQRCADSELRPEGGQEQVRFRKWVEEMVPLGKVTKSLGLVSSGKVQMWLSCTLH